MVLSTVETIGLGAVAGGTVFLGLPVGGFSVSRRTTVLLNGGAIGILCYLLVEILSEAFEPVTTALQSTAATGVPHLLLPTALVVGFGLGLVGLAFFSDRYTATRSSTGATAAMIAVGIGFHNFSEGLAIGQSAATGAVSLAVVLIIGFALHNITEGFGVAAPLANTDASPAFLAGLGLVAGGPTFLGTVVGQFWTSPVASVLFLSLAGGALIYVIHELFGVDTTSASKTALFTAVGLGFAVAFATEFGVSLVMATPS